MLDLIFFPFDFVAYYCCNKQSGQENQIIWGARRAERLLYFCPPCCREERRPGEILEEIVQFSRNSSRYGSGSRIYHGEFSGGRYAANRSTRHMRRDDRYFQAQQQRNAASTLQYQRLVNEQERTRREATRQREEQTLQHQDQQRLQQRLEELEMEERRQQQQQPSTSQAQSQQKPPRPVRPKQCAPPRRFSWLPNRSRDNDDDESDNPGNWSTASSNNRSASRGSSLFRLFSFRKKKSSGGPNDSPEGSIVRETTTLSEQTPPERRPSIPDESPPTYASINFDGPATRDRHHRQEEFQLSITTDESDVEEYESPKMTGAQAAAEMDKQWKRSTLSICSEKSSSSSDISATTMSELERLNPISSEKNNEDGKQEKEEPASPSQEDNTDQKKEVKAEAEEGDKHESTFEAPVNTSTPISAVRVNPRLNHLKRREMPVPPSPLASNSFDGRLNTIIEDSSDEASVESDVKDSPTLTKLLDETRARYKAMKEDTVKGETKPYASLTADSPMTLKFKSAAADKLLGAANEKNPVLMSQAASVSVSHQKDNVADKENMKPLRQDLNSNYTESLMHVTPSDDEFFSFDSITSPAEFSKSLMAPSRFTPRDFKIADCSKSAPKKEAAEEESDDSDVDVVTDAQSKIKTRLHRSEKNHSSDIFLETGHSITTKTPRPDIPADNSTAVDTSFQRRIRRRKEHSTFSRSGHSDETLVQSITELSRQRNAQQQFRNNQQSPQQRPSNRVASRTEITERSPAGGGGQRGVSLPSIANMLPAINKNPKFSTIVSSRSSHSEHNDFSLLRHASDGLRSGKINNSTVDSGASTSTTRQSSRRLDTYPQQVYGSADKSFEYTSKRLRICVSEKINMESDRYDREMRNAIYGEVLNGQGFFTRNAMDFSTVADSLTSPQTILQNPWRRELFLKTTASDWQIIKNRVFVDPVAMGFVLQYEDSSVESVLKKQTSLNGNNALESRLVPTLSNDNCYLSTKKSNLTTADEVNDTDDYCLQSEYPDKFDTYLISIDSLLGNIKWETASGALSYLEFYYALLDPTYRTFIENGEVCSTLVSNTLTNINPSLPTSFYNLSKTPPRTVPKQSHPRNDLGYDFHHGMTITRELVSLIASFSTQSYCIAKKHLADAAFDAFKSAKFEKDILNFQNENNADDIDDVSKGSTNTTAGDDEKSSKTQMRKSARLDEKRRDNQVKEMKRLAFEAYFDMCNDSKRSTVDEGEIEEPTVPINEKNYDYDSSPFFLTSKYFEETDLFKYLSLLGKTASCVFSFYKPCPLLRPDDADSQELMKNFRMRY
ncbi:Oidioi.mRNA.OKI2018_I69.PAR.g12697.t1.cds [Oikopleura dioica]|uniref:Oidioi.mRNA.OKI2018_I69.PAR.g12697.t1.cds n=1 Tax=Oikopleura dioica TaxID=34765 RepID=A0ABN7S7H8_OIKDI|nr:Oidioi.mRNA.OKI2018_I69.PAR.g12697.t1.cds [Oikopleura dioica]